jgi:hypothetical protein
MLSSCSAVSRSDEANKLRLAAGLIEDVKAFGKTLGIEPTEALGRTAQQGPTLSMLWLWLQREGTLALAAPVDVRLAIGLNSDKEAPKLEQVYRVDGYSVYHRQGNEFADPRSVATVEFAEEPLTRRVKVILHEDLHGDVNFALPWEIEEAIVTPLGALAAVEYFRHKQDEKNLASAMRSLKAERTLSVELRSVIAEAERIFAREKTADAKETILAGLAKFPNYQRQFERQTEGQHAATALEAKLSHDLAYYRYFDEVAALAEAAPSLSTLIADIKRLPADATVGMVQNYLRSLYSQYRVAAAQ